MRNWAKITDFFPTGFQIHDRWQLFSVAPDMIGYKMHFWEVKTKSCKLCIDVIQFPALCIRIIQAPLSQRSCFISVNRRYWICIYTCWEHLRCRENYVMRHKSMNFHCKKADLKTQPPLNIVICGATLLSLHVFTEIKTADIFADFRST